MKDPCKGTFEYPSYECYQDIKYQFGEKLKSIKNIDQKILDFETKYDDVKLQKLNELSHIFPNFKKYLSNHHVFAYANYDGQGMCNYISYLLCDKLSNHFYDECDKEKFSIFKDFVDEYNKKNGSYMCSNKLKQLNVDEYKKMKDLYQLYDNYTPLTYSFVKWDDNDCNNILYLVYLYKEFINNYKSDISKFKTILKDFHGLMNNIVLKATTPCARKNLAIYNPDLFEEPKAIASPPPSEVESIPSQGDTLHNTGISEPSEVTSSSTNSEGEQDRAYPLNSQVSEVSDLTKLAANFVSPEPVERRQTHEGLEHLTQHESSRRQQSYVSRGSYVPESPYESRGYLKTNEIISPGEDYFVQTDQLGHGSEKENPGFMTNVQSAISGFMKDVDPVPVVGVSGGMGALFLLFRYTPVGTFFRGGRRINNRIPSRFSGQFLGGFPGYEDYDVGHIGYGPMNINPLAE
ncbi:Plasmodium vivax Vir protein, putative [Plasmodium vivax]|nr:Plasmodium vivax Vir protein, putative [Plasmodium vivax]